MCVCVCVCVCVRVRVRVRVRACVCLSVCLSLRALIASGMIWCDVDPVLLIKLYITLVMDKWMGTCVTIVTLLVVNAWQRRRS